MPVLQNAGDLLGPEISPETGPEISQEAVTAVMHEINQLGRALKELVRPEFTGGLHLGAVLMLSRVGQGNGSRCSDVAEQTGLDVSVVSRQLSSLASMGLISRHPDPSDGRAWLSEITRAGQHLLDDMRADGHRQLKVALSAWDDAELIALNHQLTRLNHDLLDAAALRKARS